MSSVVKDSAKSWDHVWSSLGERSHAQKHRPASKIIESCSVLTFQSWSTSVPCSCSSWSLSVLVSILWGAHDKNPHFRVVCGGRFYFLLKLWSTGVVLRLGLHFSALPSAFPASFWGKHLPGHTALHCSRLQTHWGLPPFQHDKGSPMAGSQWANFVTLHLSHAYPKFIPGTLLTSWGGKAKKEPSLNLTD